MRARCRALDWHATALGAPAGWPASLRTTANIALASAAPTVLLCGPDLVMLYNDAYVALAGTRHPGALGRGVWPEAWERNAPIYARARAGETVTLIDALRRVSRPGHDALDVDAYLTISFVPVQDDDGGITGIMVTVTETTNAVLAVTLQAERERLISHLQGTTVELEARRAELQEAAAQLQQRTRDAEAAWAAATRSAARTAELQFLTAELAAAASLPDVARVVVMAGKRALGAATSALLIAHFDTQEIEIVNAEGLGDAMAARYARFPLALGIPTAECIRRGAPVCVTSHDALMRDYSASADFWTLHDTQAIASVPLTVGGAVIGGMSFTFSTPREFSAEDLAYLIAIARQAAQAVDRARLLTAERGARTRAEEAQAELQEANTRLQEQQMEAELANQQLQDNAVELESQSEELLATAGQLEERTLEAESASGTRAAIVEAVTDGFIAFDDELRYTYVNQRAAEMWKHSPDALIGRTPDEVWTGTDRSPFFATHPAGPGNRRARCRGGGMHRRSACPSPCGRTPRAREVSSRSSRI